MSTTEEPTFGQELEWALERIHQVEDILNHGAIFEDLYRKALSDIDRARLFLLWGTALGRQGHWEEAAAKFADGEELELSDKLYVKGRLQLAVAKARWLIGDLEEALQYAKKAIETLMRYPGSSELTDAQLLVEDIDNEITGQAYPGLSMRHTRLLTRITFPLDATTIR